MEQVHLAAVARTTPQARRGRSLIERVAVRFPALLHAVNNRVLASRPSRIRSALMLYGWRRGLTALNRRDWEFNTINMDPERYTYTFHDPPREVPPGGRTTYKGIEGYMEFMDLWAQGWDDWRVQVERLLDAGPNRVVSFERQHGRGRGGLTLDVPYAHIYEFEQGRIFRQTFWQERDAALRSVGLGPEKARR